MKPLDPALVRARSRLFIALRQIQLAHDHITAGLPAGRVLELIREAEHELHMARTEARGAVS